MALEANGLRADHLIDDTDDPSALGQLVQDYFAHRADVLNAYVQSQLMDADRARQVFETLQRQQSLSYSVPMNKQTGAKAVPLYFTGIINLLIEANANGIAFNANPGRLTSVTRDGTPLRTLARRVDGAFPTLVNPIAIWEIKEYYYTTTFGSRVADGVYETLLDGMELEELREHEHIDILHYLMVDAYDTWWKLGRSYLCRIIDMLHMGYVDEALFGYEVVERLPDIVQNWVALAGEL